jgi:lipopolysaccharide assembly protein A
MGVRFPHEQHEAAMRWVYLIVIVVFAAAIVLFAIQNLGLVTMSFLGFSVRAPLAVLAVIVYILGAITGGSLLALLRRSVRGTRSMRSAAP